MGNEKTVLELVAGGVSDAALFSLVRKRELAHDEFLRVLHDPEQQAGVSPEYDAASNKMGEIDAKIEAYPVQTLEGLAVKMRAMEFTKTLSFNEASSDLRDAERLAGIGHATVEKLGEGFERINLLIGVNMEKREEVVDPVVLSVVRKYERRSAEGMKTFGRSMADNPKALKGWLLDIQEEAMDLSLYAERALWELAA